MIALLGVVLFLEAVWFIAAVYEWALHGRFQEDVLWHGGALLVVWWSLRAIARLELRLHRHQDHVAARVRDVATERGWQVSVRDDAVESGWTRPPFSQLRHTGASPASRGVGPYGESGVAYLEGDIFRRGALPSVFISRVAWATLPGRIPTIHLVPERWSSRLVTALGRDDLDVESADFNRRWRVVTDDRRAAHALLTPAVIDVLNGIADEKLALTFDDGRAIVWDDSTQSEVDLASRLVLVERLVRAIPEFVLLGDDAD